MKKLFLLMLAFVVIFLSGCAESSKVDNYKIVLGSHPAVTPLGRPKDDKKLKDYEAIIEDISTRDKVDLIFIGDSITEGWKKQQRIWQQYYGHRNAVNMGIGGDTTQNILFRIDDGGTDRINPKLAVLLIGINNAYQCHSAQDIADGTIAICQKLRKKLPKTKILILGIFPSANEALRVVPDSSTKGNYIWSRINKTNELVSKAADNKWIYYLNINDSFLDENGALTRDIMPDLLHLNSKGYKIWAQAMDPTIKELMRE